MSSRTRSTNSRSRRAAPPRLEPLPDFAKDPPPLLLPGRKVLGGFADLLTFRWLTTLPEWAMLAVWGVLFALPPVALITWFARGGTLALVFLCAALTLTGGGIGRLSYEHLRRRREARAEDAAVRQSRFRALARGRIEEPPAGRIEFHRAAHRQRDLPAGSRGGGR